MSSKKLLIVGGVAGGASAAARARRLDEQAEIILFERGPDISFANCGLPYHIGGSIADRDNLLVTTPAEMVSKFNITVRVQNEVLSINRDKREIVVKDLLTGKDYVEAYDNLILSPGAAPIRPPIPGINNPNVLTLRNLEDMDRIIQSLESKKAVAVVGGGYIGLEMAEALREKKYDTTLIELAPQVMGPADPEMATVLHQELRLFGVNLKLGTSVTAFEESAEGVDLILSDGERLHVDIAVLAIGVKPETKLAVDAGLELGTTGGIKVNDHMLTSDPAIYAVGDAIEITDFSTHQPALIPLAGPANRQGRIAADNIFGRDSAYKNTQGTAICKVFNLAIGMTGLSEKMAKRQGIAYEKVYVHPASHASYYPGSHPISLKLLFDPTSGKVLGAQAVGADGVDKRIDVIAVAIRAGLTVYDLEEMELTYAPPYGSAKDAVNYAGFVAANILRGDARIFHVEEACHPTENQVLVDVSNPEEVVSGTIPGAKNIPLPMLREKLGELDKDKEYLAFCRVGLRGYLACRILTQNGFKCKNLTGGYKTYAMVTAHQPDIIPEQETTSDDPGVDSINLNQKKKISKNPLVVENIDASGLQCPGPIMQLSQAMDRIQHGEAVSILSTDPGFVADVPAWSNSTGNSLQSLEPADGGYRAVIMKQADSSCPTIAASGEKRFTNVVFSSDLDKALAAFIIANGAAAMGYKVTLFFTFWGLNILRKDGPVVVQKNMVEKMFGWMMPRGPKKLKLSQMQMGGMGAAMIKGIMKQKKVMSLPELMNEALKNNVKIVACTMSMDLMGIKSEELIDGIEEGGVAMYIDQIGGNGSLFI
jgi:NADPH-dependent 2,4-dienoyl-CoA reductase/sulfur reductase-like enzyme/peroxiredoxin family protein/TusA-related sulfurtransferase/rhodanese-related sulfurtransferase